MPGEDPTVAPSGPVRSGAGGPCRAERATVLDVNADRHTVDVITEFSNRRIEEVEFSVPYCHPDGVDGQYFMPEPGAEALVLFPSDGTKPILMGYYMPQSEEAGSAGVRVPMNPGDQVIATRDGNHVIARRGGVIEVVSTPLCQRLMIPTTHLIRDIFAQYEAKSLLGEVSWRHAPRDPEGSNPAEKTWVRYSWQTREYAEDDKASVEIQVAHVVDDEDKEVDLVDGTDISDLPQLPGRNGDNPPTYLELKIIPQGEQEKFVWRFDREGNTFFRSEGGAVLEIKAPVRLDTQDEVKWTGKGGFELFLEPDGNLRIKGQDVVVEAANITLKADKIVLDSGNIRLGGEGAAKQMVLGPDILNWLANHTNPGGGKPPTAPLLTPTLSKVIRGR